MEQHDLDMLIRSHEVYDDGYKWFFDDRLLSIFSSKTGTYSNVDPYYVLITKGSVVLIRAADF